jgi:hypothetical protein
MAEGINAKAVVVGAANLRSKKMSRLVPPQTEDGQVTACPVNSYHLGCLPWHVEIGFSCQVEGGVWWVG